MKEKPNIPLSVQQLECQLECAQSRHADFPREEAMLVRLIKLGHKLISDQANNQLRAFGLSHTEYHALIGVDAAPHGMSPGELADYLCEKAANTTRLLDQLCSKGLVTREPSEDDRRRLIVRSTPAATALLDQLLPEIGGHIQTVFAGLSCAERQQLKALLCQVIGNLET